MKSCTICFGVAGCLCAWRPGLMPVRKTQGWHSPPCSMHRVRVWGATFSLPGDSAGGHGSPRGDPQGKQAPLKPVLDNIRPGQIVFLFFKKVCFLVSFYWIKIKKAPASERKKASHARRHASLARVPGAAGRAGGGWSTWRRWSRPGGCS